MFNLIEYPSHLSTEYPPFTKGDYPLTGGPYMGFLDKQIYVVWPETMVGNRNQLAKADHEDILKKLSAKQVIDAAYQPFGDGHAAEKICSVIKKWSEQK